MSYIITTDFAGQIGVHPRNVRVISTDNLETITSPGYLPSYGVNPLENTDMVEVVYDLSSLNPVSSDGNLAIFTVSISNGIATLVPWISEGNIVLPVIQGNIPIFIGDDGKIGDSGASPSDPGSLFFVMSDTPTVDRLAMFNDSRGSVTPMSRGTGAESGNAVTVSALSGVITTSALNTAGGSSYAITWTNTKISTSSVILLTLMGGTNTTKNITMQATAGAGTSTLTIYNNTASTALNGTLIIGFSVL